MPPRSIHLTGPEVDQFRRSLLSIEHQAENLTASAEPVAVVVNRLGEVVARIRYLLDRVEGRRDVH